VRKWVHKEGSFMKSGIIWGVLAVVAVVALRMGTAEAGGAAGGDVSVGSFLACHGINGGDVGQVVDMTSDELGEDRSSVRIGSAVLGCTPVRLFESDTGAEIVPNPGSFLKCYVTSVARRPASPPRGTPTAYNAIDSFVDVDEGGETVVASELRYLCGPANFVQE
jgi:hypothetical protein